MITGFEYAFIYQVSSCDRQVSKNNRLTNIMIYNDLDGADYIHLMMILNMRTRIMLVKVDVHLRFEKLDFVEKCVGVMTVMIITENEI